MKATGITKRSLLLACCLLMVVGALVAPAAAGPIEDAVAGMDDGRVRMSYPTREGVKGDGRHVNFYWDNEHPWSSDCEDGPARVELRVRGGTVVDLRLRVGGSWRSSREDTVDLGELASEVAVEYFLTMAETGRGDAAEDAILAAIVAEGPEPWPRLLALARNRSRPEDVREQAIFWLGVGAGEKATEGISKIARDDDEDLEIREQAVFALSQIEGPAALDKLMEIARGHGDPEIREHALFWLAQRDEDEVIDLFEEILLGS